MRELRVVPGEFYHVYNRGNSKQIIFKSAEDYKRFQSLLYFYNSDKKFKFRDISEECITDFSKFKKEKNLVDVLAYVLMPNHFHIIIHTLREGEEKSLGLFIKKVCMAYSLYFNEKYNRSGSLFEGRYQIQHINNDNYFKYIFSYVHLNPIKLIQPDWREKGIKNVQDALKFLEKFNYSSYFDYFNSDVNRNESLILNKNIFNDLFKDIHQKELLEWLNLNK